MKLRNRGYNHCYYQNQLLFWHCWLLLLVTPSVWFCTTCLDWQQRSKLVVVCFERACVVPSCHVSIWRVGGKVKKWMWPMIEGRGRQHSTYYRVVRLHRLFLAHDFFDTIIISQQQYWRYLEDYTENPSIPSMASLASSPCAQSVSPMARFLPFVAGVTILLSLTVFSQVVAETMPATSDAVPLLGKKHTRPRNSRFVLSHQCRLVTSVLSRDKTTKLLCHRITQA